MARPEAGTESEDTKNAREYVESLVEARIDAAREFQHELAEGAYGTDDDKAAAHRNIDDGMDRLQDRAIDSVRSNKDIERVAQVIWDTPGTAQVEMVDTFIDFTPSGTKH